MLQNVHFLFIVFDGLKMVSTEKLISIFLSRLISYFYDLKFRILDIFQRHQGNYPIIKEVDGLRFIAIMAVVISHLSMQISRMNNLDENFIYSNPFPTFLELCGYGVNIFFAVSAFILSIPFIKFYLYRGENVILKKYYLRRIRRLELPYLLVLIILLLFRLILQQQYWKDEMPHFLSSFFYSHNIIYGRRSTINPVAWTLEIEIQFYVLLPFFMKIFKIASTNFRRILIISIILIWNFFYKNYFNFFESYHLRFSIIAYLPVFFTGILLADYYLQWIQSNKNKKHFIFDIAAFVGYYFILYQSDEFVWYKQWIEFVGYILLFLGIFRGKVCNYFFTLKPIMAIGVMCYSIYLLHYSIIIFVSENITKIFMHQNYYKDLLYQSILIIPIVLIGSSFFYLFIERPFVKYSFHQ